MLLLTTIAPRRDGTVRVTGDDGAKWSFMPDADGRLVCEVDDAPLVQRLVRGGLFAPADGAALPEEPDADSGEQDDDAGEQDASAPVEANTPPATIPGTRPRGRARTKR